MLKWKKQSTNDFTLDNRKTIANCIGLGKSVTEIAQILSVHKSTISREIRRLGELQDYRPLKAHKPGQTHQKFRENTSC
ncbi:helix-turn-helix domain-containing protein [Porphyromonas gingivalis]|uniref:helix-turn-helix domain-containing protein n=1 Tax=Porphyromonas gingivalis TaxID=837 RepID=UPI003442A81D